MDSNIKNFNIDDHRNNILSIAFSPDTSIFNNMTCEIFDSIPGLTLFRSIIPYELASSLLTIIDSSPWSTVLSRRTQHYGAIYDYKKRSLITTDISIDKNLAINNIGKLLTPLFSVNNNIIEPNQCIVNEYTTRQFISAHTDASCFGPVIVSISFGDSMDMIFSNPASSDKYSIILNNGDVLVMSGEARNVWKHETKCSTSINYRRVSLTYRTF